MEAKARFTRREALKMAGLLGGLTVLSACGAPPTPTPVPPTPTPAPAKQPTAASQATVAPATPTAAAQPTAAPAKPTAASAPKSTATLAYWYPRSHPDAAVEETYWKSTIGKFETANPGIKVDWIPQSWADIFKKIVAVIESGQTPDITMTGFKTVIQFAAEKEVLPLDDVVQRLGGKDGLKPLDQYYVWNDHWWGLPNTEGSNVFFYRKDLLKEAGFNGPPQNWGELVASAKALTKGDRYGADFYYSKVNWTTHLVVSFLKAADGGILGLDGKPMLTHPNTVKAIKYYVGFLKEHKVVPPSRVTDTDFNASTLPAYGAGKVAMFAYSSGTASAIEKQFPEVWKNTGVATFPNGPSGHTGHVAYLNPMWIFAKSKYPEESKKLLEFTQTKETVLERARVYLGPVGGARGYAWMKEDSKLSDNLLIQTQVKAMPYAADGFFPLAHPVAGNADGQLYIPTMIQDIVVNNTPVEQALEKAGKFVAGLLADFKPKS